MADVIISAVLEHLASIMAEEIEQEVMLVTGVRKEVKKLTNNLQSIRSVLVDAEQRQVKELSVRVWLDQLKDLAYEIEDVLDEWNTSRLKLQIEGGDIRKRKKVCFFLINSLCLCFKQFHLRTNIARKIKDLNENLDDINNRKNKFSFCSNEVIIKSVEKPQRIQSTSMIDESKICGRENEKNALIRKLLCESSSAEDEEEEGIRIISIVGMGGIGKTTLAQLAYNSEEVRRDFDKVIWVCVSEPFDEFRLARAIIRDSCSDYFSTELEALMQSVCESVVGKKFFLVLDDVWDEDYCKWEPFYNCLKKGLHGSKILITTRKETVARIMGSTDVMPIMQLADEECWLLFKQLAFFGRSIEECEKLEKIGRGIADKCKGLPLAAKTIGSLLRSKNSEEEWQRILDSELWKFKDMEKGLLSALLLSYNELPSRIKQCFLYCAVFPKNYNIEKDELVKLWMAEGYLSVEQDEEMELIGQEYFDILASRSFFQEFRKDSEGNILECKMHDIVHDFARYLSRNECFSVEISSDDVPFTKSFSENARLLMVCLGEKKASIPISILKAKRLRSLIIKGGMSRTEIIQMLCSELSCLRTFNINTAFHYLKEIPKEVGKMIHLRYLNLSCQYMERLPDTLCELYNLKILDVSCCWYLKELPQGIGKLINLRHLFNNHTYSLRCMPAGVAKLTSLRTLRKLVVGGGSKGCSLETLKSLSLLRECGIYGLGNVSDDHMDQVKRSRLLKKKNLKYLELRFDGRYEEGRQKKDEKVLRALQLPPNVKELVIRDYRGNSFPIWNWMVSLTNLRSLSLKGCDNCERLPALGKLPSLEELHISGFKSVRSVCKEFMGIESDDTSSSSSSSTSVIAFPKLKSLSFWGMDELKEWDSEIINNNGEIMPRLSNLRIWDCPKLKVFPDYLLRKTTLQELSVDGCSILKERYQEGRREDWTKVCHISKVSVT